MTAETTKTEEELIAEESEVDLAKPVIPPPEVAAIFKRGFSTWQKLPKPHEYDLAVLESSEDATEMLWDLYLNPDNPAIAYLPKGKNLPDTLLQFQDADYLQIRWHDYYYRRTERASDWFRLPREYWLDECQPCAKWSPAIRKIVRHSCRYWKLEFELTKKAVRSAERFLRANEIQQATRAPVFEAKPGMFGFSLDLRALWARLRTPRLFRSWRRNAVQGRS